MIRTLLKEGSVKASLSPDGRMVLRSVNATPGDKGALLVLHGYKQIACTSKMLSQICNHEGGCNGMLARS